MERYFCILYSEIMNTVLQKYRFLYIIGIFRYKSMYFHGKQCLNIYSFLI